MSKKWGILCCCILPLSIAGIATCCYLKMETSEKFFVVKDIREVSEQEMPLAENVKSESYRIQEEQRNSVEQKSIEQGTYKEDISVEQGNAEDNTTEQAENESLKEQLIVTAVPVEIQGNLYMSDDEELDFNEQTIEDLQLFIDELGQFTNLKRVEMCNTNLSNEEMASLREIFPTTKFVWVVHCAGFAVRTDAVAFSSMFTGYGWGPETQADFDALRYCTDLEALDIGHHSITDISFLQKLTNLKILILAINKLDDISILSNMTQLTYLELFLNKIEDLTPLEELENLEHLNLCHNKNLGEIEPILHYKNLQRLWISYCNLTSEEIARIKEAYPDARLEFQVYESVEAGWRSTEVYTRMRNVFNTNTMDEMFLPKVTNSNE